MAAWQRQGCVCWQHIPALRNTTGTQRGPDKLCPVTNENQLQKKTQYLIIPEMMMYRASSQLGLGRASAQVANMWYGRDAFNTNTNSEPLVVTNFSSRITLEAVKSGVNLKQRMTVRLS